mgnify:CR=1 FL=1
MATGIELARKAPKYLGVSYSVMDCQKFVEQVLADCGVRKDLPGSNAWYRFLRQHGWVGTPAECKNRFGSIPVGAFLFIHERDGGEEARGYHDGLGNASHIGLYTAMSASEMGDLARKAGNGNYQKALFGSGAINSSSSRGMVSTSAFAGKAINGGWNVVGLWEAIDYGKTINEKLRGKPEQEGKTQMTATVVLPSGASGNTVNMRERADRSSGIICRVPVGATVEVLQDNSSWCQIGYSGQVGWMMSNYLEFAGQGGESGGDIITVDERLKIETALTEIEDRIETIRETLGRG